MSANGLGMPAAARRGAPAPTSRSRAPARVSNVKLHEAERDIVQMAIATIRERHESGQVPDHMHYHNSEHTIGVIDRARAIGQALGLGDRHLLLTVIAAAWHDSVQRWMEIEGEGGVVTRKRFTGRDEVASAAEAVEAMGEVDLRFSPEECGIVASAILGTIPGWDGEQATVSQPFLIEHPVVRAVALADLGSSGMDPDMYRRDGPALFAEENIDLMEAITDAGTADDIPSAVQGVYRARYIAWLKVQPGFARGRRMRLEAELADLDEVARVRVLALFSRFDESVEAAEEAVRQAESLDFVTLMRQLEPSAFPDEPWGDGISAVS
jgi:hypothetical protein